MLLFALLSVLAQTPAGPNVKAETAELQTVSGAMVGFDGKEGLVLATPDGKTRTVAAADLAGAVLIAARAGGETPRAVVFLRNGDTLCGAITGGDENTLKMALVEGPAVELPLTEVGAIGLSPEDRDAAWPSAAMAAAPTDDTVVLRNGDSVAGLLAGFTADSLTLTVGKDNRTYKLDRIRKVVTAKVGDSAKLKPDRPALRVRLTGGSAVTAVEWKIGPASAEMTLLAGAKLTGLKTERIERFGTVNGRVTRLADLEPLEAVHTPFLGSSPVAKPMRNRNVRGGAMVLNGKRPDSGWGVASRTRLVFDLDGKYRRFVSDYGIDDAVSEVVNPASGEPYADCVFRVYLDGKLKFEKAHVRWGRTHPRIELDVAGGKKLTLEVDFGDNDAIQDVADWADAMLLK